MAMRHYSSSDYPALPSKPQSKPAPTLSKNQKKKQERANTTTATTSTSTTTTTSTSTTPASSFSSSPSFVSMTSTSPKPSTLQTQHTTTTQPNEEQSSSKSIERLRKQLAALEIKIQPIYERQYLSSMLREEALSRWQSIDRVTPLVPTILHRQSNSTTFAAFDETISTNPLLSPGLALFDLTTPSHNLSKLPSLSFPLLGVAFDNDAEIDPIEPSDFGLDDSHSSEYNSFVVVGTSRHGGWPQFDHLKKFLAKLQDWNQFYDAIQALQKKDDEDFLCMQNLFLTLAQLELRLNFLTCRPETSDFSCIAAVFISDFSVEHYPTDGLSFILNSPMGDCFPVLCDIHTKGRIALLSGQPPLF